MQPIEERLRKWAISTDAVPASDLMDEAAGEIERLRSRPCPYVTGTVTRYCTLNTSEKPNSSTLTDAERKAVERASIAYELLPTEGAQQVSSTLLGLLERLGGGE